jgi:hypothetical protein
LADRSSWLQSSQARAARTWAGEMTGSLTIV